MSLPGEYGRRIKIVGGPSPADTKVIDIESGEQIMHVQDVKIIIQPDGANVAYIKLKPHNIEIEAISEEE